MEISSSVSKYLRSLNYVVASCARKMSNIGSSEMAAECIKMFVISDIAETVAMRRDIFIKRLMSNSSAVCQICCAMSGHLQLSCFLLVYYGRPME